VVNDDEKVQRTNREYKKAQVGNAWLMGLFDDDDQQLDLRTARGRDLLYILMLYNDGWYDA